MNSAAGRIVTPEIITMILESCDKNTVVNLLTTCYMFWDIGANIIWSRLESLHPIITCMPEGLWRIEEAKCAWDADITVLDGTTNNLVNVPYDGIVYSFLVLLTVPYSTCTS
jgi:hypothetical protein